MRFSLTTFVFMLFCITPQQVLATLRDTLYDDYRTDFYSFVEVRNGWRIDRNQDEKDASIAETRLQVALTTDLTRAIFKFKGDLVGDLVEEESRAELRDFSLSFSPLDNVDIIAGRQIITWGTGDLVFINDLFAKDWESFFIGRDTEYLKAPNDALKTSIFFDAVNLDLVYMPVFNGSKFIDGSRISYWNNLYSKTGDRALTVQDEERNRFGNDSEFAARLSKNISGTEAALYFYSGFWQTPEGLNSTTRDLLYPRLSVYGLSLRTTVLGGIGNIETGYYDSRQDPDGDNGFIRNSEIRFLLGFEHELGTDFTGAFQYYLELKQDYDAYERSFGGVKADDEYRHLLSARLTKLVMNQTLSVSLFTYYSPSDHDAYFRPKANYKLTDQWALEAGGNIFIGKDDQTFFGQFEDNTNIYTSLRWSY